MVHVLNLIFRKRNPHFFSIEKVFGVLDEEFQHRFKIQFTVVEEYSSSFKAIIKNIIFVKHRKADINHVTGDIHYAVLGLSAQRTILTIHDTVFMENSRGIKKFIFLWLYLKLPVKNSRFITTISEKTKEEIIRYTGCKEEKVTVIPNAVSESILFLEKDFNREHPVILFVGVTPNKNLDRVIVALNNLNCKLEIIGNPSNEQNVLLDTSGIHYEVFNNLSDSDMVVKYQNCDIVLFPSLYEGFGLPVLEGQKAGRVVITSNIDPMRMVAGNAACLVDPFSVNEISSALKRVITDDAYRNRLISTGFENVKRYGIKNISQQYMRLYETILNDNV